MTIPTIGFSDNTLATDDVPDLHHFAVLTTDSAGTTSTTPTLTGTAGISPGDASTVTINIYEGSDTTGTLAFTDSADVDPDTGLFSYTLADADALPAGTYTYQATQTETAGNTGTSDPVTFTVALQAPSMVTGLGATSDSREIDLYWSPSPQGDYVSAYNVSISSDDGATFAYYSTTADGATTTMAILGLEPLTSYEFKVVAVNAAGSSPDATTSATSTLPGIATPTDLTATLTDGGLNGIHLSWVDQSADETGYEIEAKWVGTGQFVLLGTVAPGAGSGSTMGWDYSDLQSYDQWADWATENITFRVRAVADGIASNYSNEATTIATFPGTGAVTSLHVTSTDASGVHLQWDQTGTREYSILYRKQGEVPGGYGVWMEWQHTDMRDPADMPAQPTDTLPLGLLDWSDGVQVAIQAGYGSGGPVTNIITVQLPEVLDAPSVTMSVDAPDQQFNLSWDASAGANSYEVLDMEPASDSTWIGPHVYATTTDTAISIPFAYGGYFQVMAVGEATDDDDNVIGTDTSGLSNPIDLAIPATPTASAAFVNGNVHLIWTNASYDETGFQIERSNDGVHWDTEHGLVTWNVGTDVTSLVDNAGASNGTYYYRVKATRDFSDSPGLRDSGWATTSATVTFDLDVDSDNDEGLSLPSRSAAEDAIEASGDGKYVQVDFDDGDANGVPDYAETTGVSGNYFVPLVLAVDSSLVTSGAGVRFTYNMTGPDGITDTTGDDGTTYTVNAGSLRIWTKQGTEDRDIGADLIASGTVYAFADLPTPSVDSGQDVYVFYMEGTQVASSSIQAEYFVDAGATTGPAAATDTVKITTALGWIIAPIEMSKPATAVSTNTRDSTLKKLAALVTGNSDDWTVMRDYQPGILAAGEDGDTILKGKTVQLGTFDAPYPTDPAKKPTLIQVFTKRLRDDAVAATGDFAAGFPDPPTVITPPEGETETGADYVRDFFDAAKAGTYKADCAAGAKLVLAKAILDVIGDKGFDALHLADSPPLVQLPGGIDGAVAGDSVRFVNYPGYVGRFPTGAWKGENTIQLSADTAHPENQTYWGQGVGVKTRKEIQDLLARAYIAGGPLTGDDIKSPPHPYERWFIDVPWVINSLIGLRRTGKLP